MEQKSRTLRKNCRNVHESPPAPTQKRQQMGLFAHQNGVLQHPFSPALPPPHSLTPTRPIPPSMGSSLEKTFRPHLCAACLHPQPAAPPWGGAISSPSSGQ